MAADRETPADDIILPWRVTGRRDGDPLVLLHGFGGSGRSFDPVADRLGQAARVILPDLPGHGASAGVAGSRHPRAVARAVLSTLDAVGCERFHLGGFSMGGAVACLIALDAPERVRSLTLLAPGGFGREIAAETLRRFGAARSRTDLRDALAAMVAPGAEACDAELAVLEGERRNRAVTDELAAVAKMITPEGRQGEIPRDSLARIACPVRVLWGTRDPVLPVAQSADLPPHFRLRLVEGAGHMLMHEATEAVIETLAAALRDEAVPASRHA